MREAAGAGAELVVLPEFFSSGAAFDERVARAALPPDGAATDLLTNAMHWRHGTGWGAVYGLIAATNGNSGISQGAAFGTGVWLASYAHLVPMGLYEPPWTYQPKDLAMDLSYHLVYGAGVALGFRAVVGK